MSHECKNVELLQVIKAEIKGALQSSSNRISLLNLRSISCFPILCHVSKSLILI